MAADGRGSNISITNGKIKENEGEGRQFNGIEKFSPLFSSTSNRFFKIKLN